MERKHAHSIGPIIAALAALCIPLTACTSPGQQGESKQVDDDVLDKKIPLSNGSTLYVGRPETSNHLDSYESTECLGPFGDEYMTYFTGAKHTFHTSTFKLVSKDGSTTQRWYLVWSEQKESGSNVSKSDLQVLTGKPTCFNQFFGTGGKEVSNDGESGILSWLTQWSNTEPHKPTGALGVLYLAVVEAATKFNDFDKKLPNEVWGVVQGAAEDLHARSWNEFDRAAVDAAVNGEVSSDSDPFPNAVIQKRRELILAAASGSCTEPSPEATMENLELRDDDKNVSGKELARHFHVKKQHIPDFWKDSFSLVLVTQNPKLKDGQPGQYKLQVQILEDDGSKLSLGRKGRINLEDILDGSRAIPSDVVAVTQDTIRTVMIFEVKKTDREGNTFLTGLVSVSIHTEDLFDELARNSQIREWKLPELDDNTRLGPISAASVELLPGAGMRDHNRYLRGVLFTKTLKTGTNEQEAVISFAENSSTELRHLQNSNGSPFDPEENYTSVAALWSQSNGQTLEKGDIILAHTGATSSSPNGLLSSFTVRGAAHMESVDTLPFAHFAPWDGGNKGLLSSKNVFNDWYHVDESDTKKGHLVPHKALGGRWADWTYPRGSTFRSKGFIAEDRLFQLLDVASDNGGLPLTYVSMIRICGS